MAEICIFVFFYVYAHCVIFKKLTDVQKKKTNPTDLIRII